MAYVPFTDGFYEGQSSLFVDKRMVNAHINVPQGGAISQRAIYGSVGIVSFSAVVSGHSRGRIRFTGGTVYWVIGNTLFEIDNLGVKTSRGTITGMNDVFMASNGINISILDPEGDNFFYTPSTTTLAINSDAVFLSFGQARSVIFNNGFYLYSTDTEFFSGSVKTTNDGKTFTATDFADAETSPDQNNALHSNRGDVYVLATETTEVYGNIITAGFPYLRKSSAAIQKGSVARHAIVDFDNGFAFLGGGKDELPGVWKIQGSSVVKLSTDAIDFLIQTNDATTIENARAFAYSQNGHYFLVITVGDSTIQYDAYTSRLTGKPEWSERQSGITDGVGHKPWRAIHGLKAYGQILVGDSELGQLGTLTLGTFTEYGENIERFFVTQPFTIEANEARVMSVRLLMETGVGDATTPDPQIRMQYSLNGRTYEDEVSLSMGKTGEYNTKVEWDDIGLVERELRFRFLMSDPVPFNVFGLYIDFEAIRD